MSQIIITAEKTPVIFKRDTKGKVRQWQAETATDGDNWAWRTVAGLQDGKQVTSAWKFVEQKNIGKANETSLKDQAVFEMNAEMTKKLDTGYFTTLSEIDSFDKFKPMLAAKYEDVKFEFPVITQPKLDGIRCIARKNGLWTRAGKEIVSCPHISESLKEFFNQNPNAILDGELYNHNLRDNFNKITSLVRKTKPTEADIVECAQMVEYHIYDQYKDGKFLDRHTDLLSYRFNRPVVYVKTRIVNDQNMVDSLYSAFLEDGFEGQMIRIDKPYECKRSKSLLKRKEFLDAEFKVLRIEEGVGNWAGYVKRFVLELPDGREFGSNVRGSQAVLKKLLEDGKTPDWATCRYFTPTPDGIPRFPVVTDWGFGARED